MKTTLTRTSTVERTARFVQTRDKFSIVADGTSTAEWDVDVTLPPAWNVGLIVGESGAGKTTVGRQLMADAGGGLFVSPRDPDGNLVEPFAWPATQCVVDGFPAGMSINDVVMLMSSVGFSSPPAWLRPFYTLSIGEQFRATVARALAESMAGSPHPNPPPAVPGEGTATPPIACIDEFANAVDVTAAKVGSAAVAKCVRRLGLRLIAITTREDVAEWLEPDWVVPMRKREPVRLVDLTGNAGRSVRRPDLRLEIHRTDRTAWTLFRGHHYLDHGLHHNAACYVGRIDGEPASFTAVTHFPTSDGKIYREHRTVCVPQFQGVGLGNRMSDSIAAAYAATGTRYFSTTSHPALMRSRAASSLWRMIRRPTIRSASRGEVKCNSTDRVTASFQFVGAANVELARRFGLLRAA